MEPSEANVYGLRQAVESGDGKARSATDGDVNVECGTSTTSFGKKRIKKRMFTKKRDDDQGSGEMLYNEEADTEESKGEFGVLDNNGDVNVQTMMNKILIAVGKLEVKLNRMDKDNKEKYDEIIKKIGHGMNHDPSLQIMREKLGRATQAHARFSNQSRQQDDDEEEGEDKKLNTPGAPGAAGGEELPPAPKCNDGALVFLKYWCDKILYTRKFERIVGFIILCNCIEIGWSIETELKDRDVTASKVFESLFLVIFIGELIIRFLGERKGYRGALRNKWVRSDLTIVSIGCLCSWVIEPILESCTGSCSASLTVERWIQIATVFRLFRLFRLLRALRFFPLFKTLWKLSNGLVQSLDTIMWTFCLIVFILYVFACLCVELITRDPDLQASHPETIEQFYASIPLTMFSLIGFVTLDNASDLYFDLVMEKKELTILFIPLLLVVSIALVNLVTAVLVENAIESARLDKDYQREMHKQKVKSVMPEIEEAFELIDTSGDGEADLEEVLAAFEKLPAVIAEQVNPESLKGVFELLDFNGSGTISKNEFVDGILQLTLSEQPIETKQMLKALSFIREDLHGLRAEVEKALPRSDAASKMQNIMSLASTKAKAAPG